LIAKNSSCDTHLAFECFVLALLYYEHNIRFIDERGEEEKNRG